jgi:serine/threonine protein phosphatase 1
LKLFPLETIVETHNAEHINRLFVVGDLHGCYVEFMAELEKVKFNFKEDLVISVGDLIDRGKESLRCIELVQEPWFKAIRGNHEQMCLEASFAVEMKDFHCKHGGKWLYDLPHNKYLEVLSICTNLPIILEVKFKDRIYGFVHADINSNNWEDFKRSLKNDNYFSKITDSSLQTALWGRGRIKSDGKNKKYKNIKGIDEIYLGHTVVKEKIQIDNCYYIDTGVVFGSYLTLLELGCNR